MHVPNAALMTLALLAATGCSEAESPRDAFTVAESAPRAAAAPMPAPVAVADKAGMEGMMGMMGGMMGSPGRGGAIGYQLAQAPPAEAPAPAAPEGVSRKVVYDATLDLVVEKLDAAAAEVGKMIGSSGGYIAEEGLSGSPGINRAQVWKLRIPVDRFDVLVDSIKALGELSQFNRTSQDVTAEFYDVEARIRNKQIQEQTLNKILEERSGQLEEVLKVEVELSRVRGEIEQMQGRIRVLTSLTSLATLTLTLRERERFEPPAPAVADFPTQVARAWNDSLTSLADLGKAAVLFAVGNAVWLPFWIVGLALAWLVARRLIAAARPMFAPPRPTPPAEGA